MSDVILQLCNLLLEKAQSTTTENLPRIVTELLQELDQNTDLAKSLKQDSRMLQINTGKSKGYQVLVEANAVAYIGDQYHLDKDAVIGALGYILDEFVQKHTIVGTPNNLPRSGAITFVGRDDLLNRLQVQLQNNERIGITGVKGMGGIGKTELALQYAIYHQQTYQGGVCWLQARDQEIATQIVSFAKANLGIKLPDDLGAEEQVRFTWQRWPEGDSLIILDDVTDYEAIAHYLPPSDSRFKVLITTRLNLGTSVTQIEIEELSDENSIALLKSIVGDERIESQMFDAQTLCEWVGNLPLGLELLGRFLARKPDWAIAKLLERLELKRLDAKALVEGEAGMTASLGVAAALELSWEALNESEQDLACLLGMFAVAPIPWYLVAQCFENIDPYELEDWRDDGLRDRSLLKWINEGKYQLHQIVQQFFRKKLSRNTRNSFAIKFVFCRVIVTQAKILGGIPTLEQINKVRGVILHLEETTKQWLPIFSEEDIIWPFVGIGRFYEGQGSYAVAEFWRLQCLNDLTEILGKEHTHVATSLLSLADLYLYQGRSEEAEPLFLQAFELKKKVLGNEHPDVATSLNNLALLYNSQGRYKEAEPLFLQALELSSKVLGNEHPDVATYLSNLANLYLNLGRFEEAESLALQAFELRKKVLGNEHPDVAISLNDLANLYDRQGKWKKAEPLFLQALELKKKVLDNKHPDVATSLNNMALFYNSQGRYREAEPLFLQALELKKKVLDNEHPDVAISLNNLANLYNRQGRWKKAEPLFLQALDIRKKALGNEHPDVASSLNNLAELYLCQGRHEEAEPLFLQAFELGSKVLGNEHPDVATILNNLASLYDKKGRSEKAEPLFLQALDIRKMALGNEHPDVASSLNNLALLYKHQGRYEEAKPLYLKALDIRKKALGNEHPDVAQSCNNLAALYDSQGRYEEAEPLYLKALQLWTEVLGREHPQIADSYFSVGSFYHEQQKYQKAKSLYLIALKIYTQQLGQMHPLTQALLNWLNDLPQGTKTIPLEELGL